MNKQIIKAIVLSLVGGLLAWLITQNAQITFGTWFGIAFTELFEVEVKRRF